MEDLFKHFIDEYMDSNQSFGEDITKLKEKLSPNERKVKKQKKPIFVFSHQIDINSIKTLINDKLIEDLLENYEMFSQLFEKCLNQRLETHLTDKKICFCLKFKNLPENRNVKKSKDLKKNRNKLFSIDCLQIVSLSQTSNTNIGRKYVPKDREQNRESFKLSVKPMFELVFASKYSENYCELEDQRVFTEKRQFLANIRPKAKKKCLKTIKIIVFLEIFNETQLQCVYNGSHLESVVVWETSPSEYVLLSFDKICRPIPQTIHDFQQYLIQFPEEIRELFIDRSVSHYSFALSLAFIFGDDISISGSFFRLKLGLLLSVLSLNEYPKKNNSSLLVICDDTLMIRRLFQWSSLFSENLYSLTSASVPMTGTSRKPRADSISWTDAGALQLGADGITIIGNVSNLNELPDREKTALFHALETNEVIAKQSRPSQPSLTELELKSTIWSVIEDNIDETQYMLNTKKSPTFLWTQVFGMVYRIPKSTDNYIYSRPGTPPTMGLDEWRQTIELIGSLKPQMTVMANNLLQHYYLCSRTIRGSKLNHISLHTLISLSKSMAKLSLRLNVTKFDAIMAILLYEESLTTRLAEKVSPLSVSPVFHVLDKDMEHFIGQNCDHMMDEFENNLMLFLRKNLEKSKPNSFEEYLTQNEE